MPSNPKRPPPGGRRPPASAPASAPKKPAVELPFDEGEVTPLRADDPSPQRVPQYPAGARRLPSKSSAGASSSLLAKDLEMAASYDGSKVSEPGFQPAFLYVERGPGQGQLVPVKQGVLVVGRATSADLRIQHPSISRRHALINRRGERFFIKDLGSQNGTFVNRTRIASEVEFGPDDQVLLGQTQLKLRSSATLPDGTDASVSTVRPRDAAKTIRIAAFTLAVGIGLSGAVLFAVLSLKKGPSFEELPTPEESMVAENAPGDTRDPLAVSPPANERVPPPSSPSATATAPKAPGRTAPAKTAAATKTAAPTKTAASTKTVRTTLSEGPSAELDLTAEEDAPAPAPAAPPKQTQVAPAPVTARAPTPSTAKKGFWMEPPVFRAYMNGKLAEAIQLARSGGASDVASVLGRFEASYTAGQRAMQRRDDATAVKQFTTALELDETIGVAKSPYRVELKRQLSSLHTLAGFRAIEKKDVAAAKKAFGLALAIDPNNSRAKVQLAKLEAAPSRTTAPRPASSSIDDAFGDEPRSPSAPAADDDIDAAFGD